MYIVPELMVKLAALTALLVTPVATPIACTVSDVPTVIAPVYFVDEVVGVVPSVV